MKEKIFQLVAFFFPALFYFWLLLAMCEITMPGFAIYWIDLTWCGLAVVILGAVYYGGRRI
jgi:hypothetical protein